MDYKRNRNSSRSGSRLIFVLLLIVYLSGCGAKKSSLKEDHLPVVAVFPFFVKGYNLQGMMDATEKMIYLLKLEGRFQPLDAGESVAIVRKYGIRGIYPAAEILKKIGKQEGIDFIIIGKVMERKNLNTDFGFSEEKKVEVSIRVINAHTGKLRQVIIRDEYIEESVDEAVEELFRYVAKNLE